MSFIVFTVKFFADVPVPDFKAEADAALAKMAQQRAKAGESQLESQALSNYLSRLKATQLGHNTDDLDEFIKTRRQQEAEEEEAERLRVEKADIEKLERERAEQEARDQTLAANQVHVDIRVYFVVFLLALALCGNNCSQF